MRLKKSILSPWQCALRTVLSIDNEHDLEEHEVKTSSGGESVEVSILKQSKKKEEIGRENNCDVSFEGRNVVKVWYISGQTLRLVPSGFTPY